MPNTPEGRYGQWVPPDIQTWEENYKHAALTPESVPKSQHPVLVLKQQNATDQSINTT